jgi:GTP-binding protein
MQTKKRGIVTEAPEPSQPAAPGTHVPLLGAEFIGAAAQIEQLPAAGPPEIAFAGRSNSGKSSAINALARRTRLAYTSRTPGRTQQINFFALKGGARVADLPGYGYAAVPRDLKRSWQQFLWAYVTTRSTLVGLVLVVDARHGLRSLDTDLMAGFMPSGNPVLVLAAKADKLSAPESRAAVVAMRHAVDQGFPGHAGGATVLAFSATRRIGIDAADAIIDRWLPRA